MLPRLLSLLFIGLFMGLAPQAQAQRGAYKQLGDRSFVRVVVETRITFNNFRGGDRDSLPLTYAGLGSMSGWLVFDNWHIPVEALFMTGPSGGITIGSGIGFIAKKYRFQDPWIIDNRIRDWSSGVETITQPNPDQLVIQRDNNPEHIYANPVAFFSPDKSKLVLSYLRVPLTLGYRVANVANNEDKFNIQVGGFMDVLLGAKHKRKFEEDGRREKAVIRGNDRLLTEPIQFGVMGRLDFGKKFGIYAATMLSDFFRPDATDLELYPVEFSIHFNPF